jgi:hypothetical protein
MKGVGPFTVSKITCETINDKLGMEGRKIPGGFSAK